MSRPSLVHDCHVISTNLCLTNLPRILSDILCIVPSRHFTFAVQNFLYEVWVCYVQVRDDFISVVADAQTHVLYMTFRESFDVVWRNIHIGMTVGHWFSLK